MAKSRGEPGTVERVRQDKRLLQGWACVKCGKRGTFIINTKSIETMQEFCDALVYSHRAILSQSGIIIRCSAEPGHPFTKDTEQRTWCGDFVVGGKGGQMWQTALPARSARPPGIN